MKMPTITVYVNNELYQMLIKEKNLSKAVSIALTKHYGAGEHGKRGDNGSTDRV